MLTVQDFKGYRVEDFKGLRVPKGLKAFKGLAFRVLKVKGLGPALGVAAFRVFWGSHNLLIFTALMAGPVLQ